MPSSLSILLWGWSSEREEGLVLLEEKKSILPILQLQAIDSPKIETFYSNTTLHYTTHIDKKLQNRERARMKSRRQTQQSTDQSTEHRARANADRRKTPRQPPGLVFPKET